MIRILFGNSLKAVKLPLLAALLVLLGCSLAGAANQKPSLSQNIPKAANSQEMALLQDPAPLSRISPSGESGDPALTYCFQGAPPNNRIVVVEKSRQRMMILRYLGELLLEHEYACATGSQSGTKTAEGDERTPEGIYFTTHRHLDKKITIFGDRAIHLNYPNPFDASLGRKGNGIYIHGTNQPLKDRSSNGCLVMRTKDLAKVSDLIVEQQTPVIVLNKFSPSSLAKRLKACKWATSLEARLFRAEPAGQWHQLVLIPRPGSKPNGVDRKLPGLAQLDMASGGRFKINNQGMLLLGLGKEWVLVADQSITGPGRKHLKVRRRLYLSGTDPVRAGLLRAEWIVQDRNSANMLMAWAPRVVAAQTKPAAPQNQQQKIQQMLAGWVKAWQAKNLRSYMQYYAPSFKSNNMNRRAWRRHKAYLNRVYKVIKVRVEDVKISIQGKQAKVSFVQHYRSDWHRDLGRKDLNLVYRRGKWQITSERWTRLPNSTATASRAGSS